MDNLFSNLQKQTRKMWNICRHKGGLCENKQKINKDYVKILPFYIWDYVKNIIFAVVIKDFKYGQAT